MAESEHNSAYWKAKLALVSQQKNDNDELFDILHDYRCVVQEQYNPSQKEITKITKFMTRCASSQEIYDIEIRMLKEKIAEARIQELK